MNRYLFQYQPRRLPGQLALLTAPLQGAWKNVVNQELTAEQAMGKLIGIDLDSGKKGGPLGDDVYFYRVVPVEPLMDPVPPIPRVMLVPA